MVGAKHKAQRDEGDPDFSHRTTMKGRAPFSCSIPGNPWAGTTVPEKMRPVPGTDSQGVVFLKADEIGKQRLLTQPRLVGSRR